MNAILEQVNSTGSAFVSFALPMLVQSSVLIVVLLALDIVLRKKIRAVFRYWIWMIVLLKLVLPTTLSSPTSPAYWVGDESYGTMFEKPIASMEFPMMSSPVEASIEAPTSTGSETPPVLPAKAAVVTPSITWQGYVFLAWSAAVLVMVALLIQRAFFVRRLIAESGEASDTIMNALEHAREQMGIRRPIPLRLSPTAVSPSVCGLLRPTILIPKGLPDEIDPRHMKSILLHELAHIRRSDLWVNSIQAIAQIIYIYNPLLWLANAIIRKVREQAVDEMVLVAMGEEAEDYPKTLLNISKLAFGSPALSLRLIGVVESKKALIGRIKHITSRPFPTSAKLGMGGLVVVVILSAALLPMARAERTSESGADVAVENEEALTISLHEAATRGDIEEVKSLISKGADVNAKGSSGVTLLHVVSNSGQVEIVRFLLTRGADVNCRTENKATPICGAAWFGYREIVEILLENGAEVNAVEVDGWTPVHYAIGNHKEDVAKLIIARGGDVINKSYGTTLHYAVRSNCFEVVKQLIALGKDVNVKDRKGNTPLHDAARSYSDPEMLELLIAKGADTNAKNKSGQNPLHMQMLIAAPEKVKLLVSHGCEVNAKDNNGLTPLHQAAKRGLTEVVRTLVANGADVNAKDKDGVSPIYEALRETFFRVTDRHLDVVDMLLANGVQVSTIHLAAYTGDLNKLKGFIENGAFVNAQHVSGLVPMHTAAKGGQKDAVAFLIAEGANVDIRGYKQRTPLHYAADAGRKDLVKQLIAEGADVNAKCYSGGTPLHFAAYAGHQDTAEQLIMLGADVDAQDLLGCRPLFYAMARRGYKDMISLLIEKGADIHLKRTNGNTYLHAAVRVGQKETAEWLLTKGADVNAKNKWDQTPLHYVARGGTTSPGADKLRLAAGPEIAKMLLARGADVNARDHKGKTPLNFAKSTGEQTELIELLLRHGARE